MDLDVFVCVLKAFAALVCGKCNVSPRPGPETRPGKGP